MQDLTPRSARITDPGALAAAPDGRIAVASRVRANGSRIRLLLPSGPTLIAESDGYRVPSQDGSRIYHFDAQGRHQRTTDALTGATLIAFEYLEDGHLASVTDADARTTTIAYTADGATFTGPDGHITRLGYGDDGLLATVTDPFGLTADPAQPAHSFSYHPVLR